MLDSPRITNPALNQKYVERENEVLKLLQEETVARQLVPFTLDMIAPGSLLVYTLAGEYGCHIIRDPAHGYTYNPENNMRGGIHAGLFSTLPENIWRT